METEGVKPPGADGQPGAGTALVLQGDSDPGGDPGILECLGREDDIVILENAFIYTGSPSVVSTLWKVDERATAQLVTAFYRNLVDKKMSKAEALTQAQKKMKDTSLQYKDPYFWAGFMLRGAYQ